MNAIGNKIMSKFDNVIGQIRHAEKKERRANRSIDIVPDKYVRQYAHLRNTLMQIANTTRSEIPDSEYRQWSQDLAYEALALIGRIK